MLRGLVQDTIAEDVIRQQVHVVQADGPFFPARGDSAIALSAAS